MKVTKQIFGTLGNGQVANLYTVDNGKMSFCVTDYWHRPDHSYM